MKRFAALVLGFVPFIATAAAPVPNLPPAPTIEGKYALLSSSTNGFKGKARGFAGRDDGTLLRGGPRSTDAAISKSTIVIDGRTATWEYTLDARTKPMSIDITVTPLRGKKTKMLGIVEQTGDKLILAYASDGGERPKDFEDAEGVTQYIFQKLPPPLHAEYRIVPMIIGREADAEKKINALAKDGFEVTSTTTAAKMNDGSMVLHIVLKRMVK